AIQHSQPFSQPPTPHDFCLLPGPRSSFRAPVFECAPGAFGPDVRRCMAPALRPVARLHHRHDGILGRRRPRGLLAPPRPSRQLDFPRDAVPRGAAVPPRPPPRAFRAVRGARMGDFGGGGLPALSVEACRAHLSLLGCLGIILAEFSFEGIQKIPFTCSYLPGRTHIHVTFLFWIYVILGGMVGCAVAEREMLQSPAASAALLAGLGIAALVAILRNKWLASSSRAELRFEEEPPDRLISLDLSWDGGSAQHSPGDPSPEREQLGIR